MENGHRNSMKYVDLLEKNPFIVDEQKPKPTGKLTVCYYRNRVYS